MANGMSMSDAERPTGGESLEIYLLGPFRVLVDDRMVTERQWSRRKPSLLIKLLALQPHHQLHREQLIELLWPDSHFILTRGQQMVLMAPGKLYIDVEEFERQADAAMKSDQVAACETAIGLYQGDLLNEDVYEDWSATHLEQFGEQNHA